MTSTTDLLHRDGSPFTGTERVTCEGKTYGYTKTNERCHRCGGAGGYEHWPGFTCFRCAGRGVEQPHRVKLYTAGKLAQMDAAKAKLAARKVAQAVAMRAALAVEMRAALAVETADRRQAFEQQHGALLARVETVTEPFVVDIVGRAWMTARISDKQVAVLEAAAQRAAERAQAAASSAHVATVGERIEVAVTVARVASFERAAFGRYNASETVYITTMVDAAGNQIVVKSPRFHEEQGAAFTLRATVVEHSTYRDVAQTVVQRALVVHAN